jgi:hypothetical protein
MVAFYNHHNLDIFSPQCPGKGSNEKGERCRSPGIFRSAGDQAGTPDAERYSAASAGGGALGSTEM